LGYEAPHVVVLRNGVLMSGSIEGKLKSNFYEISIISGVVVAVPGRVAALRL
jgi:hypothetical protein